MPQDSGPEPKGEAEVAAAAGRVLDDLKAEPVPEKILQLARKLDEVIAGRRKAAGVTTKPG